MLQERRKIWVRKGHLNDAKDFTAALFESIGEDCSRLAPGAQSDCMTTVFLLPFFVARNRLEFRMTGQAWS